MSIKLGEQPGTNAFCTALQKGNKHDLKVFAKCYLHLCHVQIDKIMTSKLAIGWHLLPNDTDQYLNQYIYFVKPFIINGFLGGISSWAVPEILLK